MDTVLLSGRSNPVLGGKLAAALGLKEGRCLIKDFADGEIKVEVKQEVAGCHVFILQSTASPTGQNLLELLLLADAARRRGARTITLVIPYFGYARQDRRVSGEEPVGARLMTDLLGTRCDRIVAIDLHNEAVEGFASVPLLHLSAVPLLAEAYRRYRSNDNVLVAPDSGAVKLVQRYAALLKLPVATIEKIRKSDIDVAVQAVTGEVKDKAVVLVDDMISTGGTMVAAIKALHEAGARKEISIITSHCLMAGQASARLEQQPIQRVITSDSVIPQKTGSLPIEISSLADGIADALQGLLRL
ncbi:MAG: ribose-phosphate pyrophosphokinase [Desulfuromonadales bacterium]|nr:ribose-phosphate pyrophosphokinase [Desulfuromonadales bacterium]